MVRRDAPKAALNRRGGRCRARVPPWTNDQSSGEDRVLMSRGGDGRGKRRRTRAEIEPRGREEEDGAGTKPVDALSARGRVTSSAGEEAAGGEQGLDIDGREG